MVRGCKSDTQVHDKFCEGMHHTSRADGIYKMIKHYLTSQNSFLSCFSSNRTRPDLVLYWRLTNSQDVVYERKNEEYLTPRKYSLTSDSGSDVIISKHVTLPLGPSFLVGHLRKECATSTFPFHHFARLATTVLRSTHGSMTSL